MCILTLLGGISLAVPPANGVKGTSHDLSVYGFGGSQWNFATFQICVFCHTPHGGTQGIQISTYYNASGMQNNSGTKSMLLWNRSLSNATSFSAYSSSTMNASTTQIRSYSLLCLSCHDGVGALNVLSNYPRESSVNWGFNPYNGDGSLVDISGGGDQIGDVCNPSSVGCNINIGDRDPSSDDGIMNLSNDHPVSFDYDASLVALDSGLSIPNNTQGYVVNIKVRLFPNASGELKSLECSTCHDVHNYGSDGAGTTPFLVISNVGSALCTNCHLK